MEAHILVAEDEARLRTIIRDSFTAHGLTCALAKDGEEALERLRERGVRMCVATGPTWTDLQFAGRCGRAAACPFCFSLPWGERRMCSGGMPWGRTTM